MVLGWEEPTMQVFRTALVTVAVVLGAGAAAGQWVGQAKGEGALVVRDEAPGFESKSSMDVKRTFSRGDAVAGFHKEFIATTYEFFEENGRVRVLYPKPDSALMDDCWMEPKDLMTFVYDCCDEQCIPVKGSFKRAEWNPCFKDGMNRAKGLLLATRHEGSGSSGPGGAAHASSGPKEAALTNADIVAMVKAELGDELVIAKVQQAPREALDVSAEALIALRQQGIGKPVLDAMIKRAGQRK
jgi:hypothetical protein